jgi:hypothetical protein
LRAISSYIPLSNPTLSVMYEWSGCI